MSALQGRIAELVSLHGSLRAAAKAVDLTSGYMVRLRRDADANPGAAVLRKLGLPETLLAVPPAAVWPEECEGAEWRAVVGFEGHYSVSDTGLVRSEPRMVPTSKGGVRAVGGILVAPKFDEDGYPAVTLHRGGRTMATRHVHRLLLEAFVGPCPEGMESCHNDGKPANCVRSNLRWDTKRANALDKLAHGTMLLGETHHKAKLTEAQALAIRADARSGRKIAAQYGISVSQVCCIRRRESWKWL